MTEEKTFSEGERPQNTDVTVETDLEKEKDTDQSQETEEPSAKTHVADDQTVLSSEYDALNTRYLRLMADFDNYKRRVVGEKKDLVQYSNMELVKEMLPVLDAFDLAMQAIPKNADENLLAFIDGMEKIRKQLKDVLGKAGLTEIEADCTPYDPNYHEAIMLVEDDSVPPQTITDVLRAGYMFKEKVIRPTVCRVSQG